MLTVPKSRVVRGFSLRRFFCLCDFRGRNRRLLGAIARARISEFRRAAAAAGRDPEPWARRHRGWLGLSIWCGARSEASPSCAPSRIGTCASASSNASGVAEVASVGGFVKQYSVVIDPRRSKRSAFRSRIGEVIKESNMDVGGRTSKCRRQSSPCAAAAISRTWPTSSKSSLRTRAAFRCCSRTWRASSSPPTSAAASPK